jgi:hypothetical protein
MHPKTNLSDKKNRTKSPFSRVDVTADNSIFSAEAKSSRNYFLKLVIRHRQQKIDCLALVPTLQNFRTKVGQIQSSVDCNLQDK